LSSSAESPPSLLSLSFMQRKERCGARPARTAARLGTLRDPDAREREAAGRLGGRENDAAMVSDASATATTRSGDARRCAAPERQMRTMSTCTRIPGPASESCGPAGGLSQSAGPHCGWRMGRVGTHETNAAGPGSVRTRVQPPHALRKHQDNQRAFSRTARPFRSRPCDLMLCTSIERLCATLQGVGAARRPLSQRGGWEYALRKFEAVSFFKGSSAGRPICRANRGCRYFVSMGP